MFLNCPGKRPHGAIEPDPLVAVVQSQSLLVDMWNWCSPAIPASVIGCFVWLGRVQEYLDLHSKTPLKTNSHDREINSLLQGGQTSNPKTSWTEAPRVMMLWQAWLTNRKSNTPSSPMRAEGEMKPHRCTRQTPFLGFLQAGNHKRQARPPSTTI